jgi:pyruvate/2-oxoglutarate dehydrogenase complex dihydrolipoamide dehydrogenase (E3) component
VVVESGAEGLTAAHTAARRGARTALVSDGPLGRDCTHTGCVPSNALLAAAAPAPPATLLSLWSSE